jgi:hypothetical protein
LSKVLIIDTLTLMVFLHLVQLLLLLLLLLLLPLKNFMILTDLGKVFLISSVLLSLNQQYVH